ncbi:MAG: hypothetical protein PWP65_1534 [Clostridia bacterium]|nr:hypothetical protein [Clostridia bacterium]
MATKCQEIINLVAEYAPPDLAAQWDNVGLLVGDPSQEVRRVLVSLDVTREVIDEALARGANLIISHHPLIFEPLRFLRFDTHPGKLVQQLISENIALYTAHTNLDHADLGVSYHLGLCLGLQEMQVLAPEFQEKYYKLVVFVPQGHEQKVMEALGRAGAGWIGNYSHCTFRALGTGTFLPLEDSSPFIGQKGKLEEVQEYRLETIVPRVCLQKVIRAMIEAHPYEEVAYDVYPLAGAGKARGPGRIGVLPQPEKLGDFAYRVKEALGTEKVAVTGDWEKDVVRVAVCGGAGAGLWPKALQAGADVLVTGDVKYHEARAVSEAGMALIDAGHYATERVIVPALVKYLEEKLQKQEVMVLASQNEHEPWQLI